MTTPGTNAAIDAAARDATRAAMELEEWTATVALALTDPAYRHRLEWVEFWDCRTGRGSRRVPACSIGTPFPWGRP